MDNTENTKRYKMNSNQRKLYFKEYYLKSKMKKNNNNNVDENDENNEPIIVRKRGRPRKIIPPFKIIRLDKSIELDW